MTITVPPGVYPGMPIDVTAPSGGTCTVRPHPPPHTFPFPLPHWLTGPCMPVPLLRGAQVVVPKWARAGGTATVPVPLEARYFEQQVPGSQIMKGRPAKRTPRTHTRART